jgi:hypothetical protein
VQLRNAVGETVQLRRTLASAKMGAAGRVIGFFRGDSDTTIAVHLARRVWRNDATRIDIDGWPVPPLVSVLMSTERPEPPDQGPPEPCRKCGGSGHKSVPETIRALFGDQDFSCDRCRGTGIESPPE